MTRHDFAHDLLLEVAGVHGQDFYGSLWALMGWMVAESGQNRCDGVSGARNNPLNTTLILPGSTPFNSAGVRNYAAYDDGVKATALTLKNSRYAKVVDQMKRQDGAIPDTNSILVLWEVVGSPWGTTGRDAYGGLQAFLADKPLYNRLTVG